MSNIKVSKNMVIRDGTKLIPLNTAEKTVKNIDYMWFSRYEGGTFGFDFDSGDIQSITGGQINKIRFPDWELETDNPCEAIVRIAQGEYKLESRSSGIKKKTGVMTIKLKVNDAEHSVFTVPTEDFRGIPSIDASWSLQWGVPSLQCSVIYRGNLFIGKCYAFCLGGFVVLMQDDLRFDGLCTLSGAKNLVHRGYVLRVRDIIISPNPYIVQMVFVHHTDPELQGFQIKH